MARARTPTKDQSSAESIVWSERIVLTASERTTKLAEQGFGTLSAQGLALTTLEAAFLHGKKELVLTDARGTALSAEQIERRGQKADPHFWVRLAVFADLRARGYVVKTALKYGADFRVYDRGVKPGEDHSRWIVYPVHERSVMGWHEFSARNRVAHSSQKRLMLGIVDDEGAVIYYEVRWVRP
jgi:tRNA-intron endonuclease, archaea type